MPFISRINSNYPVYPQFGNDPNLFNNVLAVTLEEEILSPAQTIYLQMKVGASEIRIYDMAVEFIESEIDFRVIEGPTLTDGVTPVNIGNADRNSSFVSSITCFSDPTGITGGSNATSFEHFGMPSPIIGFGDTPPFSVNYVTFRLNTDYVFEFTNVGTVPIVDFRFVILWAE